MVLFVTFFNVNAYSQVEQKAETDTAVTTTQEHTEGFNAGKMIMGHIGDEHDWHIIGDFTIPLPCILYSKTKGLDVFLSSNFEPHHGEERKYNGYEMKEGKISLLDYETKEGLLTLVDVKVYDFSITKNVLSLFVSAALLLFVFLTVARSYKTREGKAPKGLQSWLEPLILFVRDDIAKPTLGTNYKRFMPLLLTIFFFIFFGNLLGLIPFFPGGANLTGNIAIPFFLAIVILIVIIFIANKHYWGHIVAMPGVPKWVLIILTPIEILGFVLRPFVLMIRLFANITAGHIIALAFYSLIFIFGAKSVAAGYGVSVVSVLFTVFMFCLDLLVAFLQAFVFTLLSSIYFSSAIEVPEHH